MRHRLGLQVRFALSVSFGSAELSRGQCARLRCSLQWIEWNPQICHSYGCPLRNGRRMALPPRQADDETTQLMWFNYCAFSIEIVVGRRIRATRPRPQPGRHCRTASLYQRIILINAISSSGDDFICDEGCFLAPAQAKKSSNPPKTSANSMQKIGPYTPNGGFPRAESG